MAHGGQPSWMAVEWSSSEPPFQFQFKRSRDAEIGGSSARRGATVTAYGRVTRSGADDRRQAQIGVKAMQNILGVQSVPVQKRHDQ